MNICCIICSDSLSPSNDNYSTPCGHIFHYVCLIRWIERSKTCPQCRVKTTEHTIHRIFFNLANTDHIKDDVGTLQNKLDSLQCEMKMKEKDVKEFADKYKKTKAQNFGLKKEVAETEARVKSLEQTIYALQDQLSYCKARCRERADLADEITRLKTKLKEAEAVQTVIHGTRDEVNDIIRNEHCAEQLAMLVAILKKTLADTENKKRLADTKARQLQSELIKKTREAAHIERANQNLQAEVETMKKNWHSEKKYLTSVVEDMHKTSEKGHTPTVKRILNESPLAVPKQFRNVNNTSVLEILDDCDENAAASGRVIDLEKSFLADAPSFSLNNTVKPAKYTDITKIRTSPVEDRLSRFQQYKVAVMKKRDDIGYDGLGGHSVDHIFPSSSSNQGLGGHSVEHVFPSSSSNQSKVMKRKKSTVTSVSSVKFKKLEPQ